MGLVEFICALSFNRGDTIVEEEELAFLVAYGQDEIGVWAIEDEFGGNGLELEVAYKETCVAIAEI